MAFRPTRHKASSKPPYVGDRSCGGYRDAKKKKRGKDDVTRSGEWGMQLEQGANSKQGNAQDWWTVNRIELVHTGCFGLDS